MVSSTRPVGRVWRTNPEPEPVAVIGSIKEQRSKNGDFRLVNGHKEKRAGGLSPGFPQHPSLGETSGPRGTNQRQICSRDGCTTIRAFS